MNVIFFGAGASYGAGGISPRNPPLGNELYQLIKTVQPEFWDKLGVDSETQTTLNEDFESGMDILYSKNPRPIQQVMRAVAELLLQFRIRSTECCYSRLLQDLPALPITFATLNYDCLFETAIYGAKKEFGVLKLNGSVNWFIKNIQGGGVISLGTGSIDTKPAVIPNLDEALKFLRTGNAGLTPAMAIYKKTKTVQVCPTAINAVRAAWKETVGQAEKIIVIGVRYNGNDSEVWEPLKEARATVYYVGDSSTANSIKVMRGSDTIHIGTRFQEDYGKIVETLGK